MQSIMRNIAAGVVPSLFTLAYSITYGALIFTGPLQPYLAEGVAASLMTGAVTCIVLSLTSSFRPMVAGPDGITVAVLASMTGLLGPTLVTLPPAEAVDLVIVALGGATLVAAVSQYSLGFFRLGKLVRFIPYPVIAGFVGCTGWLLLTGSTRLVMGAPIGPDLIPLLDQKGPMLQLGLAVAWAACLWGIELRFRHPLAMPAALVAVTIATHLAIGMAGLSVGQARAAGILFAGSGGARLDIPWLHSDFGHLPWYSLLPTLGSMAVTAVISVISILLNSSSIELASRTESDLDHELRRHGLANLVSLLCGGFSGNVSISRTLVSRALGGSGRLPGLVAGIVILAVILSGRDVASYMPRFVLGGLLLQLGIRVTWEWTVGSFRRLPLRDWATVVAIMALTACFGTIWGLLYGVIACCVILALDVGRITVIRHAFGLDERPSSRLRAAEEMRALALTGHRVQILALGGFVFFGSAHRLYERVKALVAETGPRALIFDFSGVDGVDSSAGASFTKISSFLGDRGVALVPTGLNGAVLPFMREALTQAGDAGALAHLTSGLGLDEMLEQWEDRLLAESGLALQGGTSLVDWLSVALGSAGHAAALAAHLTAGPLAAGDYLCRQGDPTDTLLFLESGRVSVLLEEPGKRPVRVRVFGPKTILGEVGFFLDTPRTASLRADEPTVTWSLTRADFAALRREAPDTMAALFTYVVGMQSERLAFSTRQIAALHR
jgi:SulP family sulfate permease